MPVKAIVDSLDDLPDALKELYRPGDDAAKGKFVLDVEPVSGFALEHIEGLRNAFGTTKTELESAKGALEAYKGLPAASTVRDKLRKLERLEQFDPEGEADKLAKARAASAIEDATAKFNADLTKATAEADRLWGALNGALVASAAKDAIIKENGSPALLMPHVKARTKVDRETLAVTVMREDGVTPFYNNKGEPATIDDLIADLKKHADYGRAFEATASGSGANPARTAGGTPPGKNPWAKGSFNLTEQMQIKKADPNRAAHLEALAKAS